MASFQEDTAEEDARLVTRLRDYRERFMRSNNRIARNMVMGEYVGEFGGQCPSNRKGPYNHNVSQLHRLFKTHLWQVGEEDWNHNTFYRWYKIWHDSDDLSKLFEEKCKLVVKHEETIKRLKEENDHMRDELVKSRYDKKKD